LFRLSSISLHLPDKPNPVISSLTVVSAVALTILGKDPDSKPLVVRALALLHVPHKAAESVTSSDHVTSAIVTSFALAGIFLANFIGRDRSAMKKHPKHLHIDFPEQTYKQRLKRFTEILTNRLTALDDETKWDDYFFAPLDAEVEISDGSKSRKKVVDLMKALKTENQAKLVLVLGDPGAGKSIALRTLAKELLKEVDRTGRVPVYANLKEWNNRTQGSPAPTVSDLRAFVLSTLKGQNLFADQFLAEYFDRMFDQGRFFFLLDSFDEIPSVLDTTEASVLIESLSTVRVEFFASQESGRGIIASRFYRRPRLGKDGVAIMEIRPFSDQRIHQALKQSSQMRDETLDELFTLRTELIPVARNPFSAALLRMYAETHAGSLPSKQLDMYESYISSRLTASLPWEEAPSLGIPSIVEAATEIGWAMFNAADIGLEATTTELRRLLPQRDILPILDILRYSGLARLSTSANPRFSFVHRRINEYFVGASPITKSFTCVC
jgi:hypothetical protein